jgi:F-type H+/Na+-transporting ATPase subunit alpha
VMIIWCGTNGHLDDVAVADIGRWEQEFSRYMGANYRQIGEQIARDKTFPEDAQKALGEAVEAFKQTFST